MGVILMTRKGNAKPVGSGNKQAVRNAQGQFIKGVSGNARGRPGGSRSQATLIAEQLLLDDVQEMTQQMISLAKSGNVQALKFCLERVLPPARERPLQADLPLTHPTDVGKAMTALMGAIREGRYTPSEVAALSNLVANFVRRSDDAETAADKKRLAAFFPGLDLDYNQ